MKRITLLVDVVVDDRTISSLQKLLHDEPIVEIDVRRNPERNLSLLGRFIGAQESRGSE